MEIPTDPTVTEPASDSNHGRGRAARGGPKRPTAPSRGGRPRKRKKSQQTDPDASYDEKPQKPLTPSTMDRKQLYQHYKAMEEAHRIELEKLQGELESSQKFQSAYLALCGNVDGGEMDDDKIGTRFSETRELCSSWVSKFSSPGPLTRDDELAIKNINPAAMDEGDLESIFAALRGEEYGKNVVLHSFLSHFICQYIIDPPFFFLGPWGNPPSAYCGDNIEESLWNLMQSCRNKPNNDSPYTWVFDTLYFLQPSFYKDKTEKLEWAAGRRKFFYAKATDVFLTATPNVLLKPVSGKKDMKERFDELEEAIRASGELVLKLRDQKVGIRPRGRNSQTMMEMEFRRNSVFIEPHPGMLLGPQDNRLNGKAIGFFVEPAIVADWVDKETETRREKCWSKAVVWVAGRERAFRGETFVGNNGNIALDSVVEDGSSQTPENSATHARSGDLQHSSDSDVAMLDLSSDVGQQQQQEAASPYQGSKMDGEATNSKENEMTYTVDSDNQPASGKIQGSHPRANSTPLKIEQGFLGKESGNIEGQRISTSPNPEPTPGTENESSHRATEDAPSIKEENPPRQEFRWSISEYESDDGNLEGSEKIQASPPEETPVGDGSNGAQCDRFSNKPSDELHVPDLRSAQKGTPDRAQGICDTTRTEKSPTAALSDDENYGCIDCLFPAILNPDPSPQRYHAAVTESIPNLSGCLHSPPKRANASTPTSNGEVTSSSSDIYKNVRTEDFWNGV
ncbi:hypothetical protein FQN51_008439 [Onygenales sp. PD_10]|nr:hypothetical protein FQN51_008439 [Onygenales sp. PD_10]